MGTQPENTHGIQTQTQHNPYPKFGLGPGITLGYPNFGYPIPTLSPIYSTATISRKIEEKMCSCVRRKITSVSGKIDEIRLTWSRLKD